MIGNITKDEEKVLTKRLVNGLLNDPRPNAWEKEFLVSISGQLLTRDLSDKQLSVIRRMKQKYSQKA